MVETSHTVIIAAMLQAMSIDKWSLLTNAITLLVITATAVAALIQLRHLRAQNTLNAELARAQATVASEEAEGLEVAADITQAESQLKLAEIELADLEVLSSGYRAPIAVGPPRLRRRINTSLESLPVARRLAPSRASNRSHACRALSGTAAVAIALSQTSPAIRLLKMTCRSR